MKPGRPRTKPKSGSGRSSNRAVTALAVMGGLVLLYGWNSFFLAPKAKAKADVAQQLAAARTQEQELRQNLAILKKLANDTQAREAELARLGRLVPADTDVAGAILILDETAKQAQVAWSSFVPAPPSAGSGVTTVGVTMQVAGSFGQIFDYLQRLEQLDRLVVVDGLQLTTGSTAGGSPTINASISARMFAAPSATPAGSKPASTKNTDSGDDPAKLAKAGG